ncbi:hypothetical protein M405DRAFT_860551 [Rhizopogon salebrosus TDB-379]|nr:hypothetical protein M405DRAFT_860551 [Rhizopogon salebrosus TDB-379]
MASSTQSVDIGNTLGALFIGVILGAVLVGISNVQAFVYFYTRRKTGITFYAVVVPSLWTLDALHLAVIVHYVYYYLVTDFSNLSELSQVVWSFKLHIFLDIIIIFSVHALYLHRIWKASKGRSRAIPIIIAIVVAIGFGFAIVVFQITYKAHVFADFKQSRWLTYTGQATAIFAYLLIASSLCYFLATSRTGFSSIDSFMVKVMAVVVNTGILTGLCSVAVVVIRAAMPKTYIFLSIQFLFPKLYINSFLALLNTRYYTQIVGYHTVDATRVATLDFNRRTSKMRDTENAWMENVCTLPDDDDVLYPSRPAQTLVHPHRGIAVEVQMESLSDV